MIQYIPPGGWILWDVILLGNPIDAPHALLFGRLMRTLVISSVVKSDVIGGLVVLSRSRVPHHGGAACLLVRLFGLAFCFVMFGNFVHITYCRRGLWIGALI